MKKGANGVIINRIYQSYAEHGKERVKHLKSLAQETVIDEEYGEYLKETQNINTLGALLWVTGCDTYAEILEKYEGKTIAELLA